MAGTGALGKQSYKAGMEGMEGSFHILHTLPLKKYVPQKSFTEG